MKKKPNRKPKKLSKAEKKRNAEIPAKLAQATKRIFAQNQQSSRNPHQSTEIHLEGNNIHTLSLPAFREQQSSTKSETAMTPSKKQVTAKRKQKNSSNTRVHLPKSNYIRVLDVITTRATVATRFPCQLSENSLVQAHLILPQHQTKRNL